MPCDTRITEDLVVIASLLRLVTKEMDGFVLDTCQLLLLLDVLEAICLVPAGGENVERDLSTYGESVMRYGVSEYA